MSAPPLRAELGVDLATQVAHVGLTVAEATACRPNARVAHLPLSHVDRAIAVGATDGFVTLVAAPRRGTRHLAGGRLVGATVVAPTGGELIHEAALAMQTKMFVGRLAQTTHAYPTWSMAIQQAALQFFGESAGLRARPINEPMARSHHVEAIRAATGSSGHNSEQHEIFDEGVPDMVRAMWNGEVIADSDDTVVIEGNHYFPAASVRADVLKPSTHTSVCPWKGRASYHTIVVAGKENPDAAWFYPSPSSAASAIAGRIAFWRGVKIEDDGVQS